MLSKFATAMNVQDTIRILELQKDDLLKKIASIDMTIETLRQSSMSIGNGLSIGNASKNGNSRSSLPQGWDANATLKNKANFLFRTQQHFLHIREMSELAHQYEPEVSFEEWMNKFSPVLSSLKREGHIVSIQVGKSLRNTFWGSQKWLIKDETGDEVPAKGHEHKPEYVTETGSVEFKI